MVEYYIMSTFLNSAKTQLQLLVTNPIFLACVFSWFFAQFIKTVIALFMRRIHSIGQLFDSLLWKTGGLPSSHTALVTCLCTSIGFRSGISSDVFLLSLVFLMVTVRDAVGVRRSNGIHAQKINQLGKELSEKEIIKYKPIKEVMGHTPMEVIIGAILGFFMGVAFAVL